MKRITLYRDIEKLANIIFEKIKADGYFDSCLTCSNFNEQKEICELFKERPPARVIVHGCEHHEVIPF